ncbi:MAG: transitional endoplasmic reticulum ATPase [Thermoproteota archaeon]|nr:transitional endoplasmic reticulum ATPase [Thermoproteota archaeon]
MDNEFKVIDIEFALDISKRFSQTPRCDIQLSKEVINKMGFSEGDLIEIKGKRTTVARVVPINRDDFGSDIIGLTNLVRNNARVSPEETITVEKADSKIAKKIVLAPIEKHLRKSELIKGLAKKSYMNTPFTEGDVTYLRSKMLRYLLGSVTWLRVIKTEPTDVVVVGEETEFEIIPDPINQNVNNEAYYLPDFSSDDDFDEKDLLLDDSEWAKLNSLLELGLFKNLSEAMTFFIQEGIKSRDDIFQKTETVMEQLKQLKSDVSKKQ